MIIAGFAAGCDLNMPGAVILWKRSPDGSEKWKPVRGCSNGSAARVIDLVLKHRANEVARSQLQGQNESRNTMISMKNITSWP